MEIIHLILGKANPQRMNGVNKVVYQLATEQAIAGKSVAVYGIAEDTIHNYPERNFITKLFQVQKNQFRLDKKLKDAIIEKKGKAIFHLHGGYIPTLFSAAKFLHKNQIPFVFTPHGAYNVIAMQRSAFTKKFYIALFEKKILQWAKFIHCIGKSEVDGLQTIYKTDKWKLIPYGFEIPVFKPISKDNVKHLIGFCGRLDVYTKGLDILVDAFVLLQKKYADAELWLIGDGDERKCFEEKITANNISGIKFWGSKYGDEKNELLQQLNVFAHPSRNEGLPSAVLEACAMGIPAVVTDATNVGDVIVKHQCGESILELNAENLSNAIENIFEKIKSEGVETIAENAIQMVAAEFDWKILVKKFDELYF